MLILQRTRDLFKLQKSSLCLTNSTINEIYSQTSLILLYGVRTKNRDIFSFYQIKLKIHIRVLMKVFRSKHFLMKIFAKVINNGTLLLNTLLSYFQISFVYYKKLTKCLLFQFKDMQKLSKQNLQKCFPCGCELSVSHCRYTQNIFRQ